MSLPILSLILFSPIIGAALVTCMPERSDRAIRYIAAGSMWICSLLSAVMFATYDWQAGGVQFVEMMAWLPSAGASYSLGVDGISAPMVLLMSVNPGYGGQSLIPYVLKKSRQLKSMIAERGLSVDIEMDGGIYAHNVKDVTDAGVNVIVAGNAVFSADDPADMIARLKLQK